MSESATLFTSNIDDYEIYGRTPKHFKHSHGPIECYKCLPACALAASIDSRDFLNNIK